MKKSPKLVGKRKRSLSPKGSCKSPKIKMVGVGAVGCVTLPGLPCQKNGEFYPDLISKITDKKSADDEIYQGKRLSFADELISGIHNSLSARYKHGVYALDQCLVPKCPSIISAFNNATGPKCTAGKIGKDLNWIIHMEKANGDADILHRLKKVTRNGISNVSVWIKKLENILDGLLNIHKHNMFHLEMKPANMLWFGDKDFPEIVKMSDFGTSCSNTDSKFVKSQAFKVIWFNFPPSALLLANFFIKKKSISEKVLESHAVEIAKYSKEFKEMKYRKSVNELREDTKSFISQKKNLANVAESIDIYGFSLALFEFIRLSSGQLKNLLIEFCQ